MFAVGSCGVFTVMMMGKWSEGRSCTVRHVVLCDSVGEQNVMSGDVLLYPTWCGTCVCSFVLFSVNMSSNCVVSEIPLALCGFSVYQSVCLALKSPATMVLGRDARGVSSGM